MLLDDLTADVVLNGLGYGLVSLQASKPGRYGIGNAGLHDEIEQTHIVEKGNLPWLIGLNISVDEVAHVGFVRLQVEALSARLTDDLADVQVVIELLLDKSNI